jgi:SAM-dependent methyltransferase
MSTPALSAIPFSGTPAGLLDEIEHEAALDRIQAFIERPRDLQLADAFLETLNHLDPSAPRSQELTAALITALSTTGGGAEKAEFFAHASLHAEIRSLHNEVEDRFQISQETLSLIAALLYRGRIASRLIESLLVSLRRELLAFADAGKMPAPEWVGLAEAMARHNFLNEYIWDEIEAEQASVDQLIARVSRAIEAGEPVSAFDLFVIGAYRPLVSVDAVREWVRQIGSRDIKALDETLRLVVFDRLIEEGIEIQTITPITSDVSLKVRSQYEENPYPRWRHMPLYSVFRSLPDYVAAATGQSKALSSNDPLRPRVLIAGAGTGRHPLGVALSLPTAAVLAIDLSRASLAYAAREATMRNVGNVSFAQADILKLSGVEAEFDLIESCGVLHHMEDPEAGLRSLLRALKPGGYLRLALYSKIARRAITAARETFAASDHAADLAGIRAFRRDLLRSDDPALASLQTIHDFYSASEFRDLVMHVQEHQFTLPQIKVLLTRNGLKFVGFHSSAAREALSRMPEKTMKRRIRDLDAWDRFEKRNPDTFIGMYDFFCIKR